MDTTINIRLEKKTLKAMKKHNKKTGVPVSEFIRRAINFQLACFKDKEYMYKKSKGQI